MIFFDKLGLNTGEMKDDSDNSGKGDHLNTEKYKDFIWHWFLVVGYEKEKHETWIDVATYGEKVRLNLKDLWKTGCEEKGGIVIYEIKEQKKN